MKVRQTRIICPQNIVMKMATANHVKTQSAADISSHGQLGQIVQCHVLVVSRHDSKNLFQQHLQSAVILKPRRELVLQMHAQAGAIGDRGIVAPRHVGTLVQIDLNQVNNDIDVGK